MPKRVVAEGERGELKLMLCERVVRGNNENNIVMMVMVVGDIALYVLSGSRGGGEGGQRRKGRGGLSPSPCRS